MGPVSNALSSSARYITPLEFARSLSRVLGIDKAGSNGQNQSSTVGEFLLFNQLLILSSSDMILRLGHQWRCRFYGPCCSLLQPPQYDSRAA